MAGVVINDLFLNTNEIWYFLRKIVTIQLIMHELTLNLNFHSIKSSFHLFSSIFNVVFHELNEGLRERWADDVGHWLKRKLTFRKINYFLSYVLNLRPCSIHGLNS